MEAVCAGTAASINIRLVYLHQHNPLKTQWSCIPLLAAMSGRIQRSKTVVLVAETSNIIYFRLHLLYASITHLLRTLTHILRASYAILHVRARASPSRVPREFQETKHVKTGAHFCSLPPASTPPWSVDAAYSY
eukprot:1184482-Prorocentrum_minimum.AAC.7